MSAKEKCGLLDYPEEFKNELFRRLDAKYYIDTLELCIDSNDSEKKYRIEVSEIKFVGEFYRCQNDNSKIIFDRKWDEFSTKLTYDGDSVEEIASKWFLDMLSDKRFVFGKITMDLIGKSADYRNKTDLCKSGTLEINIPDNNYEDGLLEWWLKKFEMVERVLKITSKSEVEVHISEDYDIECRYLELNGRFIIPQEVFAKIIATQIMFIDSSESSNITKDYLVYILECYLNQRIKPNSITFIANYKEIDIGKKFYEYMRNKNSGPSGKNEELGLCGFLIENKHTTISFYHNDKNFNMKITCSMEAI